MKHIKDICFFEDYGLWAKTAMQGKVTKLGTMGCIAECVEKCSGKQIDYSEELYAVSQEEGNKIGCTVAQYMELCCSMIIEPEKVKAPAKTEEEKVKKNWLQRLSDNMDLNKPREAEST